jgi:hypothetical protein
MDSFAAEITCTCRCQVERLSLISRNDVLMSAFVHTQSQIEWLALAKGAPLRDSLEEHLKG